MTATKGETVADIDQPDDETIEVATKPRPTPRVKAKPKPKPAEDSAEPDDDADRVAEVGAELDEAEPAKGLRITPRNIAIATAALLVAGLLTVLVLKWFEAGTLADEKDTRQEVSAKAGEFGVALLSYDYADLEESRDRVLAQSTGSFAETYEAAFNAGLKETIAKVKASSSAEVRDVFVGNIDGAIAQAVVVLDSKITMPGQPEQDRPGAYLHLELVNQNGEWKISNVKSVAGGAGGMPSTAQPGKGKGGK